MNLFSFAVNGDGEFDGGVVFVLLEGQKERNSHLDGYSPTTGGKKWRR